jgi:histidine triad (HIT) family protein
MSPAASTAAEPGPTPSDCLFCKIVSGQIPADVVASTDRAIAFRDIDPKAPMHVLVVPREHHGDVSVLAAADPGLLAHVVALADQVAGDLADGQYRLIFNSGPRAGQSVFHVHGHVVGGAQLGWSPA